jgi:hypothetical protein
MKSTGLLAVLVLFVLGFLAYGLRPTPPQIDDAWFINLDKDKERLAFFESHAEELPVRPQRWPGTYGKGEDRMAAWRDGVAFLWSTVPDEAENKRTSTILSRPGVLGAWLSHKRLLQLLASLPVPSSHGHLILEDDIHFVPDLKAKWEEVRHEVPSDWDIVYLGVGKENGVSVSPHVLRAQGDKRSANTGCFGYLVRHGFIPHMLKQLEYMNAPIDVQIYRMLTSQHIYIVTPHLVYADEHMVSTILTM